MKKLALLLLTFISMSGAVMAADVAVNGNLSTWAVLRSNYDFNNDGSGDVGALYVEGELWTTVELTSNVKVVIELELNDQVSNGASVNDATETNTVELNQAYVEVGEFFHEAITLTVGHQYLKYSLRNNGNAVWLADEFTAFKGSYKFEKGSLDFFYGKYMETLNSVTADADADIVGLALTFDFNEDLHALFQLYYNDMKAPGAGDQNLFVIAAGVDWLGLDKRLELFLELAFQTGEISSTADRSALALDLGARWNFGEVASMSNLFVELNAAYRTGRDAGDTDASDWTDGYAITTYGLIAENDLDDDSPLFRGFTDPQAGLLAIRLLAGADFTEKIGANFLFAYYGATGDNAGGASADDHGIELDLKSTYKYSENLSMSALLGVFIPEDGSAIDGDPAFGAAFVTDVSF